MLKRAALLVALAALACKQHGRGESAAAPQQAAAAPVAAPPPPPEDAVVAAAARLAGSIAVGGKANEYLETLSDRHGQRLTGSPSYSAAADWAVERLRAAGLTSARREEFTIANGWERGAATARVVAPTERALAVVQVPWSPPTAAAGVRGAIVILDGLAPEKVAARASELAGRIVVIHGDGMAKRASYEAMREQIRKAYDVFKKAGILGVLWAGSRPNHVLGASSRNYEEARAGAFPAAYLGLEDFELLKRLAKDGAVEVELHIDGKISGPAQVANVVADLPGRERPDEWILVGAHLDAWDMASGTQDNGAGVAMVLETARALAALGQAPRRSIRFVLWGGEEQGLLGSRAYTKAHRAELGRIVAVVNTDNGPGAPKGWTVAGREDVKAAIAPLAQRLLGGLGADVSLDLTCDTDHASFFVWGVPVLNLWVDMEPYMLVHHLASDTFDKVIPALMTADTTIVAVTTWALAEQPAPLAPRLGTAAVDKLLADRDQKGCAAIREPPLL